MDIAPKESIREWLLEHLAEYEGLYTVGFSIDKDILAAAKNLKMASTHSVGFDHIDLVAAKQLGILVTNAPQSVLVPTAELTMGLMLSTLRRLLSYLGGQLRQGK